jgi:hypothetical protein
MAKSLLLLSVLALSLSGCFKEKVDTGDPEGDTDTDTDTDADTDVDTDADVDTGVGPSFAGRVQPVLIVLCGDCHGVREQWGILDVTSYEGVVTSGAVVAFDSASSTLVTQGRHHGSGWYTPKEFEMVSEWIDAGAMDN